MRAQTAEGSSKISISLCAIVDGQFDGDESDDSQEDDEDVLSISSTVHKSMFAKTAGQRWKTFSGKRAAVLRRNTVDRAGKDSPSRVFETYFRDPKLERPGLDTVNVHESCCCLGPRPRTHRSAFRCCGRPQRSITKISWCWSACGGLLPCSRN